MEYSSARRRNEALRHATYMAELRKHYAMKEPDTKIAQIVCFRVYEMPRIDQCIGMESRSVVA